MPKLTKVELFLRPPTVIDKAFLSSATENVYLAIIKVFALPAAKSKNKRFTTLSHLYNNAPAT